MTNQDDDHLVERKQDSQELFKGKLLHAWRDTVKLPDGGVATREYRFPTNQPSFVNRRGRLTPFSGISASKNDPLSLRL